MGRKKKKSFMTPKAAEGKHVRDFHQQKGAQRRVHIPWYTVEELKTFPMW